MIRVDEQRLWQSHLDMSRVGATSGGGVTRLALTDEDRDGRDLFVNWCRAAGCTIKIDAMGSIFARREGASDHLDPVVTGSHNDTQPKGGRFDGTYGVLAGLEVIRTLNDHNVRTQRPIEVVVWTNEEGVRFRPPMIASAVRAGKISVEAALACTDPEGRTIGEELQRIGYRGADTVEHSMAAYFEAHIEQGPILEKGGLEVGVVTGVIGIRAYDVTLTGQDAHAGPTPMDERRDALLAAAGIIVRIYQLARALGGYARCTVGQLRVEPNAPSVIPGKAVFSVDCRHEDNTQLEALCQAVGRICREVSKEHGVDCDINEYWAFPPVVFDNACVSSVERECRTLNYAHRRLLSGAGHDAVHIAAIAPTAMIFVPCKEGLSHNESEYASPRHLAAGCNVLLHAMLNVANHCVHGG